MREVPECLKRRYQAMDELVNELNSVIALNSDSAQIDRPLYADYNHGIKLMCKFWNTLKEDPYCNLQRTVQQNMADNIHMSTNVVTPHDITCYQVGPKERNVKCNKKTCSKTLDPNSRLTGNNCCNRQMPATPTPQLAEPPSPVIPKPCTCQSLDDTSSAQPLTKALENMKEVATIEKQCCEKTAELIGLQKHLVNRTEELEAREQDEMRLLKEAEEVWALIENDYKQKLEESKRRQEDLLKKLKEVETSANKWRQQRKELENQLSHVDKCLEEITDKCCRRKNNLKLMEGEITDLEKKLDNTTKEIENQTRVLQAKKESSSKKLLKLKQETIKIQREKTEQDTLKDTKIAQGNEVVKEAREELTKICRVLLKKKLENEDLRAEDKALTDEINLLNAISVENKEKCTKKEESLLSEVNKCQSRINQLKLKCTKCSAETDTKNLDKNEHDCKRCQKILDKGGKDAEELVCVCTVTKLKLLNNVLDNLYTGLERQINLKPAKAVADKVLDGLKHSRTGKLDPQTRKILDVYMSEIVRRVLNLSIIGGAVKTRCEMDPKTYAELSVCLKDGKKPVKPQKEDKGTDSKKDSCALWGAPHECNCPKGPNQCMCTKLKVLSSRSSILFKKEDSCPYKKKCNQDCGHPETDITKMYKNLKPPCGNKTCTYDTNMMHAQCMLDDQIDSKLTVSKGNKKNIPVIVVPTDFKSMDEECFCSRGMGCACNNSKSRKVANTCCGHLPIPVKVKRTDVRDIAKETRGSPVSLTKNEYHNVFLRKNQSTEHVRDIAKERRESPMSLSSKQKNNTLFNKKNEYHNTFLRKNKATETSFGLKVVSEPQKKDTLDSQRKLLYIRSKNKKPKEGFCLARQSSSGNCELVLDKEYEKEHREIIKNELGDTYCNVNMSKTKSNNYLIDFKESSKPGENALLFISDMGNVRLTTNAPEIKAIKKRNSSIEDSDKKFEELYYKLCAHLHHIHNLNREPTCSESERFNESIMMKIGDGQIPIAEFSVTLKNKSDCEYFVIFNSESENNFVSGLLTLWNDQLPIKEVSERGFTVYISANKSRGRRAWLKRCSDGTIIMVKTDRLSKGVETDRYPRCSCEVSTSCQNNFCDCAQFTCSCARFFGCNQDINWINKHCWSETTI